MNALFEPGLFASEPVRVAIAVGGGVSLVSAVVGVFTVIRGQSFAGHSLGDLGTTGGSGAFLVGANPLWGFISFALLGAGAMELFGARRQRGRDMATGIVLGASLGVAALFLYLGTIERSTTGATITILFGSMFVISSSLIPLVSLLGALVLVIVAMLYRPLLLSALNQDVAAARGVPVRAVGIFYLLAMAISVSLSCVTIGAILATAVLIGPAAAALRITKRPGLAIACAAGIGLIVTWLGIVLAYDSYYWPPLRRGWPVSFFVVALILAVYVVADLTARWADKRRVGSSDSKARQRLGGAD